MPRIAAGLGHLEWADVREMLSEVLDPLPLPVFVYEEFIGQVVAAEDTAAESTALSAGETEPVLFGRGGDPRYAGLSNFADAPIVIDGTSYPTVEHYYQASKADTAWEHDQVRSAPSPGKAKRMGRRLALRRDWEAVKIDVMRRGLLAKFTQHHALGALLLSTGERPIHEMSVHDAEWGWMGGNGEDLLGRLLIELRAAIRGGSGDLKP